MPVFLVMSGCKNESKSESQPIRKQKYLDSFLRTDMLGKETFKLSFSLEAFLTKICRGNFFDLYYSIKASALHIYFVPNAGA